MNRLTSLFLDVSAKAERGAVLALTCILLLLLLRPGNSRAQDADTTTKLSRQFTQSATTALVSIHRTKENIATVVSKNLPGGYYNPNLAAQAYEHLRTAQLSANSDGDQQAALLLSSYFTKVKTWAEGHKVDRQSLNASRTMGENAISQDPDWQAIDSCEKALNAMLISGQYSSISSCQ
jgi:hypothetical protein